MEKQRRKLDKELKQRQKDAERKKLKDEKKRQKEAERLEKERREQEAKEKKRDNKIKLKANSVCQSQPTLEDFRTSVDNPIPIFLEKAIGFIEKEGLDAEGLYRVPGNRAHVDMLFQRFDEGE